MFCCHVSINRFGSEVRAPYAGNGPQIRLKRHEYFDVLYLCSGSAICHVLDRSLPFEEGDLAVIGSGLHHRIECRTSTPCRITTLFFDPDLIRCDNDGEGAEYLAPFLLQDPDFPHVVPAKTGIPSQILEHMLRIRSELSAPSPRSCLAVRTYLKMLLMLLVNHYSDYSSTVEAFQQQQGAVERLRPVFQYLGKNCGRAIQVGDAARMCGMREPYFTSFFKQVTGLSFVKYLNQYRIRQAQALLARTDRSIADISLDTGYCDQSYFGSVFRKFVRVTPAAYRRQCERHPTFQKPQSDHKSSIAPAGNSQKSLGRPAERVAAPALWALRFSSPELQLSAHFAFCNESNGGSTNNKGNLLEPSGCIE